MTKEKILDKHYEPGKHWKSVNRANVLKAMDIYAGQSSDKMYCTHPYIFIYRKLDYEKCTQCGKVLCEG